AGRATWASTSWTGTTSWRRRIRARTRWSSRGRRCAMRAWCASGTRRCWRARRGNRRRWSRVPRMRAAILTEFGQPPQIGDFDDPVAGEGGVVVDVLAAGMNPVDILKASGRYYMGPIPLPSVAGTEGVARLEDGSTVYFDA